MHQQIISKTNIGLCLSEVIEQLGLTEEKQGLFSCLETAFNKNLPKQTNLENQAVGELTNQDKSGVKTSTKSAKQRKSRKIQKQMQKIHNSTENIGCVTIQGTQVESRSAPYSEENFRHQQMKILLSDVKINVQQSHDFHNQKGSADESNQFVLGEQKDFAIVELIGHNWKKKKKMHTRKSFKTHSRFSGRTSSK